MRFGFICLALVLGNGFASSISAEPLAEEKGKVTFVPGDPVKVPERYRLDKYEFDFQMKPKLDLPVCQVEVYEIHFPSPVKSKHPENNQVYAEYYRPKGKGPFPGVIVLDILGGDQKLSRGIAMHLAQNGIAGMFVQMAYYGPRRPMNGPRLLTPDIPHTMEAIRQTVLDCRCATAWLENRPEIDAKRLGILGTSLGSFMSALTASAEPKLKRVALLLGGGGLVDAYYEHPLAKPFIAVNDLLGLTKDKLKHMIAPADPITYADYLKERQLLMIAAKRDDVVPPKAAEQLWQATGKQEIIWLDATHVGAALYIFQVTKPIIEHFRK